MFVDVHTIDKRMEDFYKNTVSMPPKKWYMYTKNSILKKTK
jgi:hypothetical protein